MFNYYGWSLDCKSRVELSNDETHLLDACIWLIEHKSTIRDTATNWGYGKSNLHRLIHNNVAYLSPDLYASLKKRLGINLAHHKRGYAA